MSMAAGMKFRKRSCRNSLVIISLEAFDSDKAYAKKIS